MALILNIETTTTNCSVCIAKEGDVIVQKSLNNKNYKKYISFLPSIKTITGLRLWRVSPRRGKNGVQTFRYRQSSDI